MRKLFLPLLISLSLQAGLAKEGLRHIEVRLPPNQADQESLSISYNPIKNDFAALTLKTKSKSFVATGFYCQVKKKHILCSGNDDTGNFTIDSDSVKIDYLIFGLENEQVIKVNAPKVPLVFRTLSK